MKIKERRRDGIAILDMSGKLMGGPDAEAFNEVLRTIMHEVTRAGGDLKLLKVTARIEYIFIVSKLSTVFHSFEDEDEAVRSFA